MHRRAVRHLAVAGVVAVVGLAPVAGCGGAPVSPLPVQRPSASPDDSPEPPPSAPAAAPTAAPTGTPATGRSPTAAPRPRTTTGRPRPTASPSGSDRPSSCLGAVRYEVDTQEPEMSMLTSLCVAPGAVLRIRNIGPGEIETDPDDLVSGQYEAGVVDIRFLRRGTVTVRIPGNTRTHTVTVVVH